MLLSYRLGMALALPSCGLRHCTETEGDDDAGFAKDGEVSREFSPARIAETSLINSNNADERELG